MSNLTFPVKSENPCTPPEAGGEIKTLTFEKLIIGSTEKLSYCKSRCHTVQKMGATEVDPQINARILSNLFAIFRFILAGKSR